MGSVSKAWAIVNGTTINLSQNSSTGKWEATATAPSTSSYNQTGHYYGVVLHAQDEAGNETTVDVTDTTLGAALQLVVKETTAPVITISYPTASAYIITNQPTIKWTVTDSDSGVNPDTIGITIDSGSKVTGSSITKTATTNGYTCTYTPSSALADGSHTVKIDASDYDGNAATQKSVAFTVDTVAPTLTISAPTNGLVTNSDTVTVAGTTNDTTSSPVTLTVQLNSGTAEAITVNSDGSFSKSLTLSSGTNTITITAKDAAGKSTTVTRTVTLDNTAPVITAVTISPNPVNTGNTYTISVTITDD